MREQTKRSRLGLFAVMAVSATLSLGALNASAQSLPRGTSKLVCKTMFARNAPNYAVSIDGAQDPDHTLVRRYVQYPGRSFRTIKDASVELSKPSPSKFIFANEADGFELIVTTKSNTRLMGLLIMTVGREQVSSPVMCRITNLN